MAIVHMQYLGKTIYPIQWLWNRIVCTSDDLGTYGNVPVSPKLIFSAFTTPCFVTVKAAILMEALTKPPPLAMRTLLSTVVTTLNFTPEIPRLKMCKNSL